MVISKFPPFDTPSPSPPSLYPSFPLTRGSKEALASLPFFPHTKLPNILFFPGRDIPFLALVSTAKETSVRESFLFDVWSFFHYFSFLCPALPVSHMRYIHSFLFLFYESLQLGKKEEEAQGRFVIVILVLSYYHHHYHQLKRKCKEEKKEPLAEGHHVVYPHTKRTKNIC